MYATYVTCKLLFAAVKPVTSEYVSTFRGKKKTNLYELPKGNYK